MDTMDNENKNEACFPPSQFNLKNISKSSNYQQFQINCAEIPEYLKFSDFDKIRLEKTAYEYLCRLEEARLWMKECIQENIPQSTELELRLRNGVYLAKLGNFIAPHVVPLKKIFDGDQKVYNASGLHYRHTDNINYWILAMKAVGLPSYFYPNSFDVYGKKNMPKAIYCLHALNLYLYRCGKGIKIIDLIGKIKFSPEEINSVTMEFQKYGIQLPAFSKIGGILSHEVTPNDAPLHAAIIAINIAICQQNHQDLLAALKNPNAQLQNVFKQNAKAYQEALLELKSQRALDTKNNFKKNELCWDFLTHEIIQEGIDSVNTKIILSDLKNAAISSKKKDFISILHHPLLRISDIVDENSDAYVTMFENTINDNSDEFNIAQIQSLIFTANYNVFKCNEINSALTNFNNILESDDYCASFNILKSLVSETDLHDLGRQFYHLQLQKLKDLKGNALNLQDVEECLPRLTALLDVSIAIIQSNTEKTYKALSNTVINCWELNDNLKNEYFNALKTLRNKNESDFLSIEQIKNCITDTNAAFKRKECSALCTKSVSYAITQNNEDLLINSLLEHPCILCVDPKHKNLYLHLFQEYKTKHPEHDLLSHNEIQRQIDIANKLVSEAKYYCASLASINIAIDKKDYEVLFNSLGIFYKNESLCVSCKEKYLSKLTDIKSQLSNKLTLDKDPSCCSWIKWKVAPRSIFCLNLKSLETEWNQEDSFASLYLCKEHIVEAVNEVQNECQHLKYGILGNCITSLQAHIRGFLVRKNLACRKIPLKNYTKNHILAAVKLQAFVRMSFVRKKYIQQKAEKLRLHAAARIIQRHWRAFKVNQNLNILAHSSNPPLPLMQKIIYMLEISNDDYSEEFQLHTLKGKAVQSIRYNQSLLREIDEMDVKIGLLIRNRITLEDLLKQKKKAKKTDISENEKNDHSFIYSKKYGNLIESFENLLYLLQTKPIYFSRLITLLPSNQATTLIESVIFSLYNFGSTPREEYLLLKMLSLTLKEDIRQKGDNLSDIIKGENIIMKIIISFYRKNYWKDCLKTLLQPLVLEVLNNKTNSCNLDPIEIYKVWQNELETQTGKKSSMPYDISAEDALCHTEVNNRFNQCMDDLLKYSLNFCDVILNNQSLIPYGMMYISKILKVSLQNKYPASSNEELLKIVGNFLYYRYINPAIIAPDVFDIITTKYNEQLPDYERLKLSAIAKFLHFSVIGKKYTEETDYLMVLNPYISDCHEKFMSFFEDICNVQSLEEHFNIDIFSEAIVNIPEVYMSLNELQTLYKLIKEREYDLAPDSTDALHEIIEDFDVNSFEEICGISSDFLNMEICLSLKNKYELEIEDETDEEKMYVETKFMVITLLQVFLNVDNVTDLFKKEPSVEEEMQFEKMCFTKRGETDLSLHWIKMSHNWKTLPVLQSALEFNLNSLELAGFVTSLNNYQEILNDIAKDIVNRWRYRTNRKKDIQKLKEIQKQLDIKTIYYLEKLDYYYKYVAACLENMKIGKHNSIFFSFRHSISNELKYKKTIKYSGSKLHEKGILLAIKNLDVSQFKNIMFEISPAEDLGIFTVNANFMGITLETVNIDIQELLNKQYQGIAEIDMFEHVKVNNNLLLHFLNSKFYGKYTT